MTTTLNHRALSREHLADAHVLADSGESDLARDRLVSAADHALRALAASRAADTRDDELPVTAAVPFADGGGPALLQPGAAVDTADQIVPADDLDTGFERVQELIDAALAQPPIPARPSLPPYGGAAGALNARGAEAAARTLARVRAALRR
jgi:hypothetical protein